MPQDLNILDAAHTIRFHLRELLNDTDVETTDNELEALLVRMQSGENVKPQIRRVLNRNPETRKWTHEFLNPEKEITRSFKKLPGDPTQHISGMKKFVCPENGCPTYWYRQQVGQEVPKCFKHEPHVDLIPYENESETV